MIFPVRKCTYVIYIFFLKDHTDLLKLQVRVPNQLQNIAAAQQIQLHADFKKALAVISKLPHPCRWW